MNHQTSECPKVIANSLFQVQCLVGTLGYDSNNEYAKYKYVSIDKYYEKLRPLLNDAGLMIIPDEVDNQISEDRKIFKATYQFTILHKDGAVWTYPIRRTIALPFTGAQSCGSALSYAEKIAMRTIFKINSGERDDADMLEQGDLSVLTDKQKSEIDKLYDKANLDKDETLALYKWLKVSDLHQIKPDQFENLIAALKRKASDGKAEV